MGKRLVLSDSSLNRYGYRVLTEGINLESFKKNPIVLYMHFRDEGSPYWGENKAIGHWKDIQIDGDVLSAEPVFDEVDELSRTVAAKFKAGTYNAASIGIRILATSGELYDRSTSAFLAAGMDTDVVPELKKSSGMNLKAKWKTVLAFLKIGEDKADSTAITEEQLESLDAEMNRLQGENVRLKKEKEESDNQLTTATGEVTRLKDEMGKKDETINTLNSSLQQKDDEIKQLKEQVENLKKSPADDGGSLTPKKEPVSEEKEDLAAFCDKNSDNYEAMAARLKEEGLI